MDYAALKAEIAKPEYGGLSDAEVAAKLNAATESVPPLPFDPIAEDAFYSAVDRLVARGVIDQAFADGLILARTSAASAEKAKKQSPADVMALGEIVLAEHVKRARAA